MSRAHGSTDFKWTRDGRCSVCGSITPERAAELLATPYTAFSSSDWTYGWPDRMHLAADVFFPVHLSELDDHEIAAFAQLTAPLLGVVYTRNEDGALDYRAVRRGFRTSGAVGQPHHPTVPRPPDGWWR